MSDLITIQDEELDKLKSNADTILKDKNATEETKAVAGKLIEFIEFREAELKDKTEQEQIQRIFEQGGKATEEIETVKDRSRVKSILIENTLGKVRIHFSYKYYDFSRPDFQAGDGQATYELVK